LQEYMDYNVVMNFWECSLWFFMGVFAYKTLSHILSLGYGIRVFLDLQKTALRVLMAADSDLRNSLLLKYQNLEKSEMSTNELKRLKLSDAQAVVNWREAAILKMLSSVPKSLYRLVRFTNWSEASKVYREMEGEEYER